MFFTKTFAASSGLFALSSAHMLMNTPKPFSVPALHNGPLEASGSDFPCQAGSTGTYSSAGVTNVMQLGSQQPLAFTGQATHGGGSCQVSITYDTAPTKNSVWKVIHSIEGGCPAKNTPGNMGNDAAAADPFTYSFPIPDNIPTGNATIAWTWLNKIGNREFYMNCAPVSLEGTSGDKSNYDALPDMLVANIAPHTDCATTEGFDYKYPNPGQSVESFASDLVYPVGNCGTTAAAGGSGSGSGSGSSSGSGSGTSATAAPPAASSVASSLPGGVFMTVPTPSAAAPSSATAIASTGAPAATSTPTSANANPAPAQPTASSTSPQPTASSGSGSGSGSTTTTTTGAQTAGSACSPEGQWNCVGGTSYQQCAAGTWSVVMQLAAGTKCTPGQSTAINIEAASGKMARRIPLRFRGLLTHPYEQLRN
ncbi:putative chitin domain 3 protein [Diplogelasinospora grovesii]|uniref:Chitin domain 3 protein n=1 Tax=Diplogelasinospora grovesii TaxID=303347 RepID=A0AAN6S9L8_9PEZI|nr:putative chitin domain 3 protein [Diplogelasinospora grovesii]